MEVDSVTESEEENQEEEVFDPSLSDIIMSDESEDQSTRYEV